MFLMLILILVNMVDWGASQNVTVVLKTSKGFEISTDVELCCSSKQLSGMIPEFHLKVSGVFDKRNSTDETDSEGMYTVCFPLTVNHSLHLRPVLCEATFRPPQPDGVTQSFNASLPIRVYTVSTPPPINSSDIIVNKTFYWTCTFAAVTLDFPEQLLVTWNVGNGHRYTIRNVTQTITRTGTYLDPQRQLIPLSTVVSTAEIFVPMNHNISSNFNTDCSGLHGLHSGFVVKQSWDVTPSAPPVRPTTTTTDTEESAEQAAYSVVGTPAKSQATQRQQYLAGGFVAGGVGALFLLLAGVYWATRRSKAEGEGAPLTQEALGSLAHSKGSAAPSASEAASSAAASASSAAASSAAASSAAASSAFRLEDSSIASTSSAVDEEEEEEDEEDEEEEAEEGGSVVSEIESVPNV